MNDAPSSTDARQKVLEVRDLCTSFFTEEGEVRAVDGISFDVYKGKTLGIVGESGCGKSVTSLSILRLIAEPPGKIKSGQILLDGQDILKLSPRELRKIRGNRVSMIFQEPMTSLNPVFTIGNQISEALQVHTDMDRAARRARVLELLQMVGIPAADRRIDEYPHQLSGGMRQRVMIAMALACSPQVLIADEPTTALDVTIQAQILDLLRDLQKRLGMAIILITHDLGVVAEMADDVMVMYAGKVVEQGRVREVFKNPRMPYTQGLLKSIPGFSRAGGAKKTRLEAIPGIVPNPLHLPQGCRFQDRCPHVIDACRAGEPVLREIASDPVLPHAIRCIRDIEWRPA